MTTDTARAPMHLISLGAGVQSSTMALMAAAGEITPMPAGAIFADTQAEPASVYKWLDWLEGQLPFPVHRVTAGSLTDVSLRIRHHRSKPGKTWAKSLIPAYVANPDGTRGLMGRSCTADYKLRPLLRMQRKLAGVKRGEKEMTRNDCLRWMLARGYPKPPRSACVYCPFHSDHEWRRLRDEEPEEFARAAQFERDLQAVKRATTNINGVPFLHNSLKPLTEVDFSTDTERGQLSLFGNECEGMCGV